MGICIRKRGKNWTAEVRYQGKSTSRVFKTKNEAKAWAEETRTDQKSEVKSGVVVVGKTLQDAFKRYADEVSSKKKGERWERIRLQKLARETFSSLSISAINKQDITDFINQSLETVISSTVNRELNLLSAVFSQAIEWGWCKENPIKLVKRPKDPPPRDRLISSDEIAKILIALDFDESKKEVRTGRHEIAIAFLLAMETAMRQGEIWKLTWENVFLDKLYVHLPDTKNGTARDVPLTARAIELIQYLGPQDSGLLFKTKQASAGALFRRAVKLAGIENLTFHDTRHEGTTRLGQKLSALDLSRVTGHKDYRYVQRYYNETATNIAKKL